ncbi:protein of unknown function [Aminobacter niigataensis]|nr:protein of unknown function [Aminobacter niigataensis]
MNVLGALQILASLPDDEDFYVGPVAKAEGEHALSLLYMFDLDAPKVSSHDSESVVFSWERGEAKYYLSVGDGGASFIRSTPDERGIVGHAQLDEAAIVGVLRLAGDHVGGSERVTG